MAEELTKEAIAAINTQNAQALKSLNSSVSNVAKMKIMPFEIKEGGARQNFPDKKVSINPESYSRSFSSGYKKEKDAGGKQIETKIIEFAESLSFDIWLDSTGAIPDTEDVSESIKWLINNLVKYDGDIHSTRYVQLSWASLMFEGQLKTMSIQYLYFERAGFPLRAKVSLSFESIMDPKVKERGRSKSSPDLTHLRVVEAGDNLPLMCYHIYNSTSYYLQVAKANGLANFTNLELGQTIFFPPLDSSNT